MTERDICWLLNYIEMAKEAGVKYNGRDVGNRYKEIHAKLSAASAEFRTQMRLEYLTKKYLDKPDP